MLINMSGRYMDLGDTEKEYSSLVKAGAIARQLHNDALIAEVECDLVETEQNLGHGERAAQRLAAGTQALARVAKPPPLTVAYCMDAQSVYADAEGHTADAIKLGEQEAAFLERAGETNDVQYQSALSHIALLYSQSGNTKKALEIYERQVAVLERSGQLDTVAYTNARQNIAVTLNDFGEVRNGCTRQGEPVTQRQSGGGEDVKSIRAVNWGTCLFRLGKPQEALVWYDKALDIAQKEQNLNVQLYSHGNRARALIVLQRLDEAEHELNTVSELAKKGKPVQARAQRPAHKLRAPNCCWRKEALGAREASSIR